MEKTCQVLLEYPILSPKFPPDPPTSERKWISCNILQLIALLLPSILSFPLHDYSTYSTLKI